MDHRELDGYLRSLNEVEQEQQRTGNNINDIWPLEREGTDLEYFRMPADAFSRRVLCISASITGSPPCRCICTIL